MSTADDVLNSAETRLDIRAIAQALGIVPITVHKYMSRGIRLATGERIKLGSFLLNGRRYSLVSDVREFVQKQLDAQEQVKRLKDTAQAKA